MADSVRHVLDLPRALAKSVGQVANNSLPKAIQEKAY